MDLNYNYFSSDPDSNPIRIQHLKIEKNFKFFPVFQKNLTADYCGNNLLYLLVYLGTTVTLNTVVTFHLETKLILDGSESGSEI